MLQMQCMADEIAMLKVDLQGKDQQLQDEELRNSKVGVSCVWFFP